MSIEIKERKLVASRVENHYKVIINGKEVYVSRLCWFDEFDTDRETEIFKGQELLTDEEIDEVIEFVNDAE
jgi:hypothetical protein